MLSSYSNLRLIKIFLKMTFIMLLSENCTVKQIINKIKLFKSKIKIKFVYSEIMNQLSYHVSKNKLSNEGLNLNIRLKMILKTLSNYLKTFR